MKTKNIFLISTLFILLLHNMNAQNYKGSKAEVSPELKLFNAIEKHNLKVAKNAILEGADINAINPLTGKDALMEALVAYHKLKTELIGKEELLAMEVLNYFATFAWGYSLVSQLTERSLTSPSAAIRALLGTIATSIASVIIHKVRKEFKTKLENAQKIIEFILNQPKLVIGQDAIDFCKTNLPEIEGSLLRKKFNFT